MWGQGSGSFSFFPLGSVAPPGGSPRRHPVAVSAEVFRLPDEDHGPGDEPAGGMTSGGDRRATVEDYFEAQGVPPYERAGRRYRGILERLARLLASATAVAKDVPPLMDVDAAVSVDCEARGVPVPDGVEQRIRLHLALLDHWLARHEEADGPPGPSLIVPARRTNTATPT